MGSPSAPVLANILMGFHKSKWLKVSEYLFLHEIKKYCFFFHKIIEKPYLISPFKFHDFFP